MQYRMRCKATKNIAKKRLGDFFLVLLCYNVHRVMHEFQNVHEKSSA